MSYWGTRKKASILKKQANWNSVRESEFKQREIILRNNGTIFTLGHSKSTGTENFLIVPHTVKIQHK